MYIQSIVTGGLEGAVLVAVSTRSKSTVRREGGVSLLLAKQEVFYPIEARQK